MIAVITSEIRKTPDEQDNRTYTIEFNRDQLYFFKNYVEYEIDNAETLEDTRMFVHLYDKIEEAERQILVRVESEEETND